MNKKELKKIKARLKNKKEIKQNNLSNLLFKFFSNILFIIILTIINLIIFKKSPSYKDSFYKNIYDTNISFASINNTYKKLFGSPMPFSDFLLKHEQSVFTEKIKYYNSTNYKEGVQLKVDKNYLVPSLESGMVVFIGDKENYPNTIIIEQVNGIEVWYSNIENVNVDMYDYIEKGKIIGSTIDDNLYLVYKKDGEILNYNDYI